MLRIFGRTGEMLGEKRGDFEGAIRDFDETLCLDPNDQDAIECRADALSSKNRRLH